MSQVDDILLDFQQADEEKRLYLFLSHRELRSEFMAMVQGAGDQVTVQCEKNSPRPIQRYHRWLLAKLLSFMIL